MTALVWSGCEEKSGQERFVDVRADDLPTHLSKDPIIQFLDSNLVKAIVYAGQARVYEKRQKTYLDSNIKVEFISAESGKPTSVLTADSAMIDDKSKDMMAGGHVKVVSDSNQRVLTTPLLLWSQKQQKFYSTEHVRIESPTQIIEGVGFESDQYLQNYTISKASAIWYKAEGERK